MTTLTDLWLERIGTNRKPVPVSDSFPANSDNSRQLATALGNPPAWAVTERDTIADTIIARELTDIIEALKQIPASLSYDDWYRAGAAIHEFDPSPCGLAVFTAWSKTSPGHVDQAAEACARKWAEYQKPKPGKMLVTRATLYDMARRDWSEKVRPINTQNSEEINGNHVIPEGVTVSQITAPQLNQSTSVEAQPKAPLIFFADFTDGGKVKATMTNASIAIRRAGIVCRRDLFHDRFTVGGHAIEEWAGDLTDDALHMLRRLIKEREGFDPGAQHTHDAAVQLCLINQYDPVIDYLGLLQWDGVPRIGTWLTAYMQAPDTPLTRSAGQLVLTAAVRRARQPGCKFDQITVLESGEGKNKSSAIEIMAGPDNFSDQTILGKSDREQQESLSGVWLYEIADLAGITRAEVERVKAFASRRVDRARPAYGRRRLDKPRRCVLWATTNESTYLISQTGNRRFWPVKVGRIDLDRLARDRDQLWAEAAYSEARGASLWLPEPLWNAAGAAQAERLEQDPWDSIVEGIAGTRTETVKGEEWRISTRELMDAHLQLPRDRQTTAAAKRLAHAMRRCGWISAVYKDKADNAVRGYIKPIYG